MNNADLLRWLGYVWTAFGAYWMSFNVLKKEIDDPGSRRWHFAFLALTFIALFAGRHKIPPALILILAIAWTALGLYWGAPSKAAQSGEFKWYRPLRLLVLAGVFALLFWNATAIGVLAKRFVPDTPALGLLGFVAATVGMFVSSWARLALGRFWSDKVILQSEHRLVRTGPYSRMRHPLYSGVLLGVLGTALVVGQWRGLLAFALLLANYTVKAKKEERILAEQFRDEFDQHRRSAGFLLPRFRS
jgi:protein-S-isoprenylcysteine O-methyltransferase Ste14